MARAAEVTFLPWVLGLGLTPPSSCYLAPLTPAPAFAPGRDAAVIPGSWAEVYSCCINRLAQLGTAPPAPPAPPPTVPTDGWMDGWKVNPKPLR